MRERYNNNQGLAPNLRFPIYSKSGNWKLTDLGPFLREYTEKVPSSTELPVYSSTRVGLQPQKDYYDDRELANDGDYGVVPDGYFVYRHMSDDGTFKFNVNRLGGKIAVSKEYPVFSVEGIDPTFLQYLLNEGIAFKRFALAQKKGGTRTRLYLGVLRTFSAHMPRQEEQMIIGDCLWSLDELIVAESQKLRTLSLKRKSLLQILFPSTGESHPRLRLPEFSNSKPWRREFISNLLEKVTKPVDVDTSTTYREIGIRSHGKGIFHKDPILGINLGEKRVFWVEQNALVINIVFAWEQAIAVTSEADKGMIASHRFPMYIPKQGIDVRFLKYLFLTSKGKELLGVASPGGAGRNKTLGQKEFEKLELAIPEDVSEQTAIVKILSSIDDLIALQGQKIDFLKKNKAGLVQQLFPTSNEKPT
ncbi:restriction endonuclease subunit S [Variovorax gossypii]|nr:restriction endonuclease subunit S [Variovorax gossypii]